MTKRLAGAAAAGAFALGILTVAAAPVLGQGPTTPNDDLSNLMTEHMAAMSEHLAAMDEHMTGTDMGSIMNGMMPGSMMGPGSSAMPMGLGASAMPMDPNDHEAHHASPAPEATR
jgi:hypothetical protein